MDLYGMPVFRAGDTVVVMGQLPDFNKMKVDVEYMAAHFKDYSCPFDFMTEFDQWFEWQKRTKFDGESTGMATCRMTSDLERIKKHELERAITFNTNTHWGMSGFPSRYSVMTS